MESLNQIQLLYVNFALLMLTASIALYIPKRMNSNQQEFKPKIHPEIAKFYKMLNQSLQINQPKLTYIVDKMPLNDFVSFYKGLKNIHGFNIDLRSRGLDHGGYTEYIVLDLANYTGPRTVEVSLYEEPKGTPSPAARLYREARQNRFSPSSKSVDNVISILSFRQHLIKGQGDIPNNVVDLNSYRKKRVNYYSPDDNNEGA